MYTCNNTRRSTRTTLRARYNFRSCHSRSAGASCGRAPPRPLHAFTRGHASPAAGAFIARGALVPPGSPGTELSISYMCMVAETLRAVRASSRDVSLALARQVCVGEACALYSTSRGHAACYLCGGKGGIAPGATRELTDCRERSRLFMPFG